MHKTQRVRLLLTLIAYVGEVATARAADIAFSVDSPAIINGPEDIRPGKFVQSPEGKVIGTIKTIVAGPGRGAFRYALVATDSGIVGIPCWAISHLLTDGHIVIGPKLLASAPRLQQDRVPGGKNEAWMIKADNYWRAWR